MGRNFSKWIEIVVMAAMLCVTGLVMSGEAQAQRFVDNGNGTVTDTQTNLMWTKSGLQFDSGMSWDGAMSRCQSFSIAGISGWRLPSKDELLGLSGSGGPFTAVSHLRYWSSTSYEHNSAVAYLVNVQYGSVSSNYKSYYAGAWPVRNAQ